MSVQQFFYSGFAKAEDIEPGTVLHNGRYILGDMIGEGAHSRIFTAEDSLLSQKVAVKVAVNRNSDSELAFDLLLREVCAYRHIGGHSNILDVYDVFEDATSPGRPAAFVTELMPHGSLRDWIVQHKHNHEVRLQHGKAIFKQLCRAVSHIHKQGVVHADLKPENCLLTCHQQPKLCDFGVAHFFGSFDARLQFPYLPAGAGTPEYMAPELCRSPNKRPDPRSDIFSIGCIGFELFDQYCRRPRDIEWSNGRSSFFSLTVNKMQGVPPKLCRVIEKCLEDL